MITKLNVNKKFSKIIHVSDIHIRLNSRREEYLDIFNKFYNDITPLPKDETCICILGDIFHSKNDLQPEAIDLCHHFLTNCANLFPTVLISGNHDAVLNSRSRMDSLTPIVESLNNPNIFYLKDNGLYGFGNILFNNLSIFSDPTEYILYKNIPLIYKNEYMYHIAMYHGKINNAMDDAGFKFTNNLMSVDKFDGHHIVLLGDIHKPQDLQQFDNVTGKPIVRYAGSMIQQNFGENINGHGYSLWDLNTKSYTHHELQNDYGFFKIEIVKDTLLTSLQNIPKNARINVTSTDTTRSDINTIISNIKKVSNITEVSYDKTVFKTIQNPTKDKTIDLSNISSIEYQNKLIEEYLKTKCNIDDKGKIDSIIEINNIINKSVKTDKIKKNIKWCPKKFEFSNMFSYGENNVIDFTNASDVIGLFSKNASGKSSIFSALSFCLFSKFDRGYKASNVLNSKKSKFTCKFNFEINGVDYFIESEGISDKKRNVKTTVNFYKIENGKEVSLNGIDRPHTYKIISEYVGTYEDFILTTLSVQNGKNISSFIDMDQSERKDLLSQFIGLYIFDDLLSISSDKLKEISSELKVYKKENYSDILISHDNELSSLKSIVNDETNQLNVLTNNRNKINEDLLSEIKKLKTINCKVFDINLVKRDISLKEKELSSYTTDKSEISNTLSKINLTSIEKEISDLEAKDLKLVYKNYQSLQLDLSNINQQLEIKKSEVNEKLKKHEMLKKHKYDPNCKFCVNSVFVQDAKRIVSELENDKIVVKNLIDSKNELVSKINDINWIVSDKEKYENLLKQQNNIKNTQLNLSYKLNILEKKILNTTDSLKELNKNVDDYNTQANDIEYNKVIQSNVNAINLKLKNEDFLIQQKNKKIIESNSRISVLNSKIVELNDLIKKIKNLENEFDCYTLYTKAVNRDGIPYMIISNTIPVLESKINEVLSQITNFNVEIEMDGKNIIPYIIYDEEKRWPIEMGSGFEKFISSLAIRISLIQISNLQRADFLVIDEGWGTMDADNLGQVKILLNFLKSNFDFVIVISHLDTIKDSVMDLMEIEINNDGFSSIKFPK